MPEYFECNSDCTKCCPGSDPNSKMKVGITVGDAYRNYLFNNPDNRSFSELFLEVYEFYLIRKTKGRTLEDLKNFKIGTYAYLPVIKSPCYSLNHECELYDSLARPIGCVIAPEFSIALPGETLDGTDNNALLECTAEKLLTPDKAEKTRRLVDVLKKEKGLTLAVFGMRIQRLLYKGAPAVPISLLIGSEMIESALETKLRSFDSEEGRHWQEQITETTRRYAEIMGFEL